MKDKCNGKKPFYKRKIFVVGIIIVAVLAMYYATNNIEWFNRLFGEI